MALANVNSDWGPVAFRTDSTYFEHQKWPGSARLRTTTTGSVQASIADLSFGDGAASSGLVYDQHDFAQLDLDGEVASEHAKFREYSPAQGRWFSPDTCTGSYDATNPQSFNRYAYGLNNPLIFVDPSGLDCEGRDGGDDNGDDGATCPGGEDGSPDGYDGGGDGGGSSAGDGSTAGSAESLDYTISVTAWAFGPVSPILDIYSFQPSFGSGSYNMVGAGGGIGAPSNPPPCNPATSHCGHPVQTTCTSVACHKEPFKPAPWTKQDTCGALFTAGAVLTGGAAPGVVTGAAASWWLWGGGVLLTVGQIPCL